MYPSGQAGHYCKGHGWGIPAIMGTCVIITIFNIEPYKLFCPTFEWF